MHVAFTSVDAISLFLTTSFTPGTILLTAKADIMSEMNEWSAICCKLFKNNAKIFCN
jgi:hypothetical protein